MNLLKLHDAVAAVCPIHGVSVGDGENKTTWIISFKDEATNEEKAAAQAVIDAADLSILANVKYISKLAIVDRLIALGKLSDAMTALNSDATKKARWDAATEIATDDVDVIAVLTACGVDYTQVLY